MKIKNITLKNYGPFSTTTSIMFNPDVTILTGANDTGKTSVLNFIDMMWTRGQINEDEANIDRTITSSVAWDQDPEISSTVEFQANPKLFPKLDIKENTILQASFCFSPKRQTRNFNYIQSGNSRTNISQPFPYNPKVVYISQETPKINEVINLENPNAIEQKLLLLAFGQNPLEKFARMSPWKLTTALDTGNNQLHFALSKIIPKSISYDVRFQKTEGVNYFGLSLFFRDLLNGSAPIHLRGAGLRKLVALSCILLDRGFEEDFCYILIDEPENSLHADAQHSFRRFLEELGKKDNLQVIYSTHSPAMINPFKGDQIRLFTREIYNGFVTTRVNNYPFENNFHSVRSSLGMSLADSLLFGPITIIVEGQTEVRCLQIIFERLMKEIPDKFSYLEKILPMLFILDGQGDSFSRWCSLIQQQGSEPVLFVDGDKRKRVVQEQAAGKLKNIPVVFLGIDKEFEELVPIDIYFLALKKETNNEEVSLSKYEDWLEQKELPQKMMFSKKVDYWLSENFPDIYYDKPGVMKLAVQSCEITKIVLDPVVELIDQIKKKLS